MFHDVLNNGFPITFTVSYTSFLDVMLYISKTIVWLFFKLFTLFQSRLYLDYLLGVLETRLRNSESYYLKELKVNVNKRNHYE